MFKAILAAFSLVYCCGTADAADGVTPLLDCVTYNAATNQVTARFGYTNTRSTAVSVGPDQDYFAPSPVNRGQPSEFLPGTFHNVFTVTFSSSPDAFVTWTVLGSSVTAVNDPNNYCHDCDCPAGPQGPQGERGERGIPGLRGERGEHGAAGDMGTTGPKGERGLTGQRGLPGERGLTGEHGERGERGAAGDMGTTGPKGEHGLAGERGMKGDRGEHGAAGDTGTTGPKGERGPQGLTGPHGEQGFRGETGAQGIAGPRGETGARGEQGIPGIAGPKGETGAAGPAGAPGSANAWKLIGTAGTHPGTGPEQNYLGTADAKPLVIATSSTAAIVIDEHGHVAVGTAPSPAALSVGGYLLLSPEGLVFSDGTVQRTAYTKQPKKAQPFPWNGGAVKAGVRAKLSPPAPSINELNERINRLEQEVDTLKQMLKDKNR